MNTTEYNLISSTVNPAGVPDILIRGVTLIRPGRPLARGPEGLGAPKGPLERASVYVRDQYLFWLGT